MMKKLTSLLLSAALLVGMLACGASGTPPPTVMARRACPLDKGS